MITAPEPALYWTLAALFGSLVIGSLVRFIALRNTEETRRRKRFASLRTWWMLAILLSAGLLLGRLGICLLLGTASCIAWFEITRLPGARAEDRLAIGSGYALIVMNYLLILFGAASLFVVFLPLAAMLVFAVSLLISGEPQGYIRAAGGLLWGMLFLGYGVSHGAYLLTLPGVASGPLGAAGWLLFLILLTESNDIFQAIVGRAFGAHKRHRITPVISPNKTWEGFIGGMLITIVLALLTAPWLTTLSQQAGPLGSGESLQSWIAPVLAAVLIALAGFFGDINMSAIKRDTGVKDSSTLLPGMGGIIDRVDSLTMTAPVFVYFLSWWLA
jgi:phosphatidate cytidylyltransferase